MSKKHLYDSYLLLDKSKISPIIGTYIDDYDINHIHDYIIKRLKAEKDLLTSLSNQLSKLKEFEQRPLTLNTKRDIQQQIYTLSHQIDEVKDTSKLKTYLQQTENLLLSYNKLKDSIYTNKRLAIIDSYLTIAKKYTPIKLIRQTDHQSCCINCKKPLPIDSAPMEHLVKCEYCSNEHQMININYHQKYIKVQNINTDNDLENFIKALMRYQGLQNKPPESIYSKLDQYFAERGLPLSQDIRSLPYNERGKKGDTNKEMLCQALAHIGCASYYEDVNLIGHIYWDWKLPNLSTLQDKIIRIYQLTQKAFYKIPPEQRFRISSLGTQFRLLKILELCGHICYYEDFKIAENNDSLQNHKRLWKMMCEIADDPEIYYID